MSPVMLVSYQLFVLLLMAMLPFDEGRRLGTPSVRLPVHSGRQLEFECAVHNIKKYAGYKTLNAKISGIQCLREKGIGHDIDSNQEYTHFNVNMPDLELTRPLAISLYGKTSDGSHPTFAAMEEVNHLVFIANKLVDIECSAKGCMFWPLKTGRNALVHFQLHSMKKLPDQFLAGIDPVGKGGHLIIGSTSMTKVPKMLLRNANKYLGTQQLEFNMPGLKGLSSETFKDLELKHVYLNLCRLWLNAKPFLGVKEIFDLHLQLFDTSNTITITPNMFEGLAGNIKSRIILSFDVDATVQFEKGALEELYSAPIFILNLGGEQRGKWNVDGTVWPWSVKVWGSKQVTFDTVTINNWFWPSQAYIHDLGAPSSEGETPVAVDKEFRSRSPYLYDSVTLKPKGGVSFQPFHRYRVSAGTDRAEPFIFETGCYCPGFVDQPYKGKSFDIWQNTDARRLNVKFDLTSECMKHYRVTVNNLDSGDEVLNVKDTSALTCGDQVKKIPLHFTVVGGDNIIEDRKWQPRSNLKICAEPAWKNAYSQEWVEPLNTANSDTVARAKPGAMCDTIVLKWRGAFSFSIFAGEEGSNTGVKGVTIQWWVQGPESQQIQLNSFTTGSSSFEKQYAEFVDKHQVNNDAVIMIKPILDGHDFECDGKPCGPGKPYRVPGVAKHLNFLRTGNQKIQHVNIVDKTVRKIEGRVVIDAMSSFGVKCGLRSATVRVMDSLGMVEERQTDWKGKFNFGIVPSVNGNGKMYLEIDYDGRVFQSSVNDEWLGNGYVLSGDVTGLEFVDTTVRTVTTKAYATGCEFSIGTIDTVELTLDSCKVVDGTKTTLVKQQTNTGGYTKTWKNLPPLPISVTMRDFRGVNAVVLPRELQTRFDALFVDSDSPSSNSLDLRNGDGAFAFEYHPVPVAIGTTSSNTVIPPDTVQSSCVDKGLLSTPYIVKGSPGASGKKTALTVDLRQEFGDGKFCSKPIKGASAIFRSGLVTGDDVNLEPCNINNGCSRVLVREARPDSGKVMSTTANLMVSTPGSYLASDPIQTRRVTVMLDGPTVWPNLRSSERTLLEQDYIIVGSRFLNKFDKRTEASVLLGYVHNPPGDSSLSTFTLSKTFGVEIQRNHEVFELHTGHTKGGFHTDVEVETCILGSACTTTVDIETDLEVGGGTANVELVHSDTTASIRVTDVSLTLESSHSKSLVGRPGDRLLLATYVSSFSEAELHYFDLDECNVAKDTSLKWAIESVRHLSYLSRSWIENEREKLRLVADVDYYADSTVGHRARAREAVEQWTNILKMMDNDVQLARKMQLPLVRASDAANLELGQKMKFEHVQFNGGGAWTSAYTVRDVETFTNTATFIDRIDTTTLDLELKVLLNGIGASAGTSHSWATHVKALTDEIDTDEASTSVSVRFDDSNPEDAFTVDVYRSPMFGTPVFFTTSGKSQCYAEPNTDGWHELTMTVKSVPLDPIPAGQVATVVIEVDPKRIVDNREVQWQINAQHQYNPIEVNLGGSILSDAAAIKSLPNYRFEFDLEITNTQDPNVQYSTEYGAQTFILSVRPVCKPDGNVIEEPVEVTFDLTFQPTCPVPAFSDDSPLVVNVDSLASAGGLVLSARNPFRAVTNGASWAEMTNLDSVGVRYRKYLPDSVCHFSSNGDPEALSCSVPTEDDWIDVPDDHLVTWDSAETPEEFKNVEELSGRARLLWKDDAFFQTSGHYEVQFISRCLVDAKESPSVIRSLFVAVDKPTVTSQRLTTDDLPTTSTNGVVLLAHLEFSSELVGTCSASDRGITVTDADGLAAPFDITCPDEKTVQVLLEAITEEQATEWSQKNLMVDFTNIADKFGNVGEPLHLAVQVPDLSNLVLPSESD